MPATAPLIDLDAAKREAAYPDGIPVTLGGQTFTLPAELPTDVLTPIVTLNLPDLLKKVLDERDKGGASDEDSLGELILDILFDRPDLPADLLQAVFDVAAALFGDQYADFTAKRPSINDYMRLASALMPLYGVSLGEALGSPDSSESGGETSSPTSNSTTASTPAGPGSRPKRRRTSASAASGT